MSRARLYTIAVLVCAAGAAVAKLPALNDEAKAKAAEAAAKTAWTDKVGAYQLCKSQDRVAAKYMSEAKKAGKDVKPAAATPSCTDPGPFAYTPPPPLEAAGAHSPPATAVGPPSTQAPQSQTQGSTKK
jgi:hypothetical protein